MSLPNYGGPPTPPPMPQSKGNSTTVLVLGILSVVCCGLCGPFAWYLGKKELDAIRVGTSPSTGEGAAKAGMILGIIGTVLLVFGILWIIFWGGLAVLSGILRGVSD